MFAIDSYSPIKPSLSEVSNYTFEQLRQLRQTLHNRLIDNLEDDSVQSLGNDRELTARLEGLMDELVLSERTKLTATERKRLAREVIEELKGMGPIAELMLDASITDILINGPSEIWIDKQGALSKTPLSFDDDAHLRRFLERIVGAQGRQLDARQPMVDARLPDGSRLHAVIPPLCALGPVVSIRRFHNERVDSSMLIQSGFISVEMLRFLEIAVTAGINIVIAGSAGSGKTSLLNVISGFIPATEREVTVEETAELRLKHPHVIPLEARNVNSEGAGAVSLRDLVRTALRMRADRIIVGEVRGEEVLDMLQAMNVGHDGSLTTLHANSPQDVISRLETLAQMGESAICRESIEQMITSSVQLIVQVMRFRDGSRRVVSISELATTQARYEVRELFHFKSAGVDAEQRIQGSHAANGNASFLTEQVEAKGFDAQTFARLAHGES